MLHGTQTRLEGEQTAPFAHGFDCEQLQTPCSLQVSLPGQGAELLHAPQTPFVQVSPAAQSSWTVQVSQVPATQASPFAHWLSIVQGEHAPETQTSPLEHWLVVEQGPQTPAVQICPFAQGTDSEHDTHAPMALHASPDGHGTELLHG